MDTLFELKVDESDLKKLMNSNGCEAWAKTEQRF